jgi:ribosomal protein L15
MKVTLKKDLHDTKPTRTHKAGAVLDVTEETARKLVASGHIDSPGAKGVVHTDTAALEEGVKALGGKVVKR